MFIGADGRLIRAALRAARLVKRRERKQRYACPPPTTYPTGAMTTTGRKRGARGAYQAVRGGPSYDSAQRSYAPPCAPVCAISRGGGSGDFL